MSGWRASFLAGTRAHQGGSAAFTRKRSGIPATGGVLRGVIPNLEVTTRLYLQYLEQAAAGDEQAGQRYEWITLEFLDQLVRDESGGDMLKFWKRNPMPAEDFVVERMGSEVRNALAALRRQPVPAELADGATPEPDAAAVGAFRSGGEVHKWMYDRWSLAKLLRECGFTEPRACAANESRIPDFSRYLLDLEADGSTRKPDSLFMEAVRPGSSHEGTAE